MRAREVEMDDAFIAAWLRKYLNMQPKKTTFSDPETCLQGDNGDLHVLLRCNISH